MAAALLRFCTSTLVPGYFFSKACANGVVRSFGNEVTMTTLSSGPAQRRRGHRKGKGGGERDLRDSRCMDDPPALRCTALLVAS